MKNVYRTTIVLALITALAMSMVTVTSSAAAKEKTVKVKKATYKKYEKAYKELKKIKKENKKLKKKLDSCEATLDDSIDTIERIDKELESQKSMNQWVWSNIYSMGISYKKKVWTIPAEMPNSFMVDGVKYEVKHE